ncbi:hypothetical protein HS088_TW20G00719 [Tripterygium wilfordii]|uniref:AP-3 complex subunit delta n=1 Tax=Tripterygium wilfordii TaxID=458696 RepID=A0A7J7C9D1_TRIWF|nr:AP-3 complex subunit delta-like [Tripterygium wilfordii]KAF5730346.1 hypothetical protein HS088_TW20G00719 [Tripterygium wilfordii]
MAATSLMDTLFQRTLEDLIKGLRQAGNDAAFISRSVDEIRREIKSTDSHTKSVAVQKLSYLNSLHGVDMSWAAFHAVECVSASSFAHKKAGYHAITQSFNDSTPVLLLITNQLRKDLTSTNSEFEVSMALECLARIGTVDLARDLTPEIFTLLSSSKLSVRKKAISVILRVFEKYPDAVRVCFKRLVENLESNDQQILSTVVGVFCELASRDARSYLPLAPEFYRILVDSKNNWVLIKVLKIFSKFAPLEPRLAKRVVEPICEHMRRTGAKSLLFECVRTVVTSLTEYESAVKLAVMKIREFLVDEDPNLKYLGLHSLSILAPEHLWAVLENKEVVIKSLSDADPNIKLESLRLVMAMVSESNVAEICRVLFTYAIKSDPEFCNEILGSILSTCGRNVYEIIIDFDWYVSLLGEMSRIPHCQKGEEVENQLIDIGMRVKDARPELVRVGRDLLIDPALLGSPFLHRILSAAAWISGEYVEFSRNPFELMEALLQPRTNLLPTLIRSVYVHSAFKVLVFCVRWYNGTHLSSQGTHLNSGSSAFVDNLATRVSESASTMECPEGSDIRTFEPHEGFNPRVSSQVVGDLSIEDGGNLNLSSYQASKSSAQENTLLTQDSILSMLNLIVLTLAPLSGSNDVELQERTRNVLGFVDLVKKEISNSSLKKEGNFEKDVGASQIIDMICDAFSEELGPVSLSAQERVSVPDGLVLLENLADLDAICGDVQLPSLNLFSSGNHFGESVTVAALNLHSKEESEPSGEFTSLLAEHRKRHGLYYLPSEKNGSESNDYPPANDPNSHDILDAGADAEDLVKLTAQSLVTKKKSTHAKTRPVVVKLDGDEAPISSKKQDMEDDSLSGAVRDILLGAEAVPASRSNQAINSSTKNKGKEKLYFASDSKENIGGGEKPDSGNPSSRRSKHKSHGKERRRKSQTKKDTEERDETDQNEKRKSSHRDGKHKARERAEGPLNVVPPSPVIPDFLL